MTAIKITNVYKSFKIYYDKGYSLKDRILFRNRNRHENRPVLKGIDLEVQQGEAIGLIGENGCGKSTLLKLMTKILYPDRGEIQMQGRISSLIELGAGFHPDMTGRENIYTNAAIFGLTRSEINERLQDIIDFSELGDFIDSPVRTYSSGMYMRLAFAVAINVDADILLVDEILAVGDANFQAKCFSKLREIKGKGTTIVIVSHSLGQIEQICERSVWIQDGRIKMQGNPYDIHPIYLEYMGKKYYQKEEIVRQEANSSEVDVEKSEEEIHVEDGEKKRWGNGAAKIEKVILRDKEGKEKQIFKTGEFLEICIYYRLFSNLQKPNIGIGIFRNDGTNCYGTNTFIDRIRDIKLNNRGEVCCVIDQLQLLPGEYKLDVAIQTEEGFDCDYYKDVLTFKMFSDISDIGVIRIPHSWKF